MTIVEIAILAAVFLSGSFIGSIVTMIAVWNLIARSIEEATL